MNWLSTVVWLLPILFMIHDFEEIMMVIAWRKRNEQKLKSIKKQPFGSARSTASLSCGVFEEFLLLSVLSFVSLYYDSFLVFYGIFFAYAFHLFFHIVLSMLFKGYVPGIITAAIQLPLCVYLLWWIYISIPITLVEAIITSVAGTVVLFVNILFLHGFMSR